MRRISIGIGARLGVEADAAGLEAKAGSRRPRVALGRLEGLPRPDPARPGHMVGESCARALRTGSGGLRAPL